MHRTSYVNDPFVIAQNDRMVAINSAIQVDLTGQVCADSIGTKPYSGFGGQVDFIRGAARSKGGKPIIALPSTAKNGTVSRIVPVLDPGAGVVTQPGRRTLRRHRARGRLPARQDAAGTGGSAHGRRRPEVPRRTVRLSAAHYIAARRFGGVAGGRHNGGFMTDGPKLDKGTVTIDPEECKGCGLCVEACTPRRSSSAST